MTQLMTRLEVSRRLQVSLSSLDRLRSAGRLKSIRVGGLVRFDPADVQAYIDEQRKGD
jgi:excisionase family DNA binding protein